MEAGRDAHDVSGQDDVEDLALAVAQQLVTDGVAVLYERELAILLAVNNEVAPPRDRHFALDDGVQGYPSRHEPDRPVATAGATNGCCSKALRRAAVCMDPPETRLSFFINLNQ